MKNDIKQKFENLNMLIGNTPLAKIKVRYNGKHYSVYAKLEYYNYSGSIKDRMALHILRDAYTRGLIKSGDEISEATSGNTGISFAALGSYLGHKVTIFMPDWMSSERKKLIESFGATVVSVTKEQGGFIGSIEKSAELAKKGKVFLPRQFENQVNAAAHFETTGPEIAAQLKELGITPDAFVAGVGTGGTLMGAGGYLRTQNPKISLYPVEPSQNPVMSTGIAGDHRIGGIGDDFIPAIVKLDKLNEVICVDDGDAIIAAQMLAKSFGMGVGISSGANLLAAVKAGQQYGKKHVATVFADDSKKYLSTDYSKSEPQKPGFMTRNLELVSYEIVRGKNI